MRVGRILVLGVVAVAVGVSTPAACLGQDLEQAAAAFAAQCPPVTCLGSRADSPRAECASNGEAQPLGALSPQRAGASIREYLGNREAASARVSRTGEVGGEPPRGFAEIRWESRIRGMSEMITRTVFVAFVYEDGAWRVAELRILPQTRL